MIDYDPNKIFVWDSWFLYDPEEDVFHIFYLNASAPDARQMVAQNKQHFKARVGHATTQDFETIDYKNHSVLSATPVEESPDNTSIWTGNAVFIGPENDFCMAFTSRDQRQESVEGFENPMTQHISFAVSRDAENWQRVEGLHIHSDPRFYNVQSNPNDVVCHAWRDPFMFRLPNSGHAFMLVSAQVKGAGHGVKGQKLGEQGALALLKTKNEFDMSEWEATGVSFCSYLTEAEVPCVYWDEERQMHLVCFSSKSAEGYIEGHKPDDIQYGFYGFHVNFEKVLDAIAKKPRGEHLMYDISQTSFELLNPQTSSIYACQIVPEKDGIIVGFDTTKDSSGDLGGICVPGPRYPNLRPVLRNFENFTIQPAPGLGSDLDIGPDPAPSQSF